MTPPFAVILSECEGSLLSGNASGLQITDTQVT